VVLSLSASNSLPAAPEAVHSQNTRDFLLNFSSYRAVVTAGYQHSARPSFRPALWIVTQRCGLACMMFVVADVIACWTLLFFFFAAVWRVQYGGIGAYYLALFVFNVGEGVLL